MAELKILLPTDGTSLMNEAASLSVNLIKALGGEITVLHVIDSKLLLNVKDNEDQEDTYKIIKRRAQEIVDDGVAKCSGVTVKGMIIEGDPKQAIIDVSREYSIIVMGTAGKKGIKKALLGSVADGVLEDAKCPVVTVKSK